MISNLKRSMSLPAKFISSTPHNFDAIVLPINEDPHPGCIQAASPAASVQATPTPTSAVNATQGDVVTNNVAVEERAVNSRHKLIESSIYIAAQTAVTLLTFWFSNGSKPLSGNAKVLRDFAAGCNVVGYIASFTTMLIWGTNKKLTKKILTVIAYSGAAFGFLAVMGMVLPENLKLWITAAACAACLPALVAASNE